MDHLDDILGSDRLVFYPTAQHGCWYAVQDLQCPMCRTDWGAFTWRAPSKRLMAQRQPAAALQHCHPGTTCSECHATPISGPRYSCVSCWRLDLCHKCFSTGSHPQHDFVVCQNASSSCKAAPRDLFEVACAQACMHGHAAVSKPCAHGRGRPAAARRKVPPVPRRSRSIPGSGVQASELGVSDSAGGISGVVGVSSRLKVDAGPAVCSRVRQRLPGQRPRPASHGDRGNARQSGQDRLPGSVPALKGLGVEQPVTFDALAGFSVVGHASSWGCRSTEVQGLPRIKKP